jgi:uncharacterized protein
VQYLQFIPILEREPDGTVTSFSCTGEQFGRFLLDVFEQWATRDVGKVSERFIDNIIHTLLFDRASMCCYADRCANAHVLEFNGDLYVCDHFVYKQWKIGNILETPLADLARDGMLEEFAELKTELPHACRDCEFLEFCKGGCPKHHVPIGIDPDRKNWFCEGYKLFFREALPELRRMSEYFRRQEIPPLKAPRDAKQPTAAAAQPHGLPPEVAAMAGGPPGLGAGPAGPKAAASRNDPCPCGSGRKYKHCCGR